MQRISALWQASPRKLVSALFILSLAAMMAVASGASFTSTSANAGNIVTAGNLSHSNSKDPGAILSVSKLFPGQSSTGFTDIKNTGDVPGVFTLTESNIQDLPASPAFSGKLKLTINDLGNPASPAAPSLANQLYSNTLSSMGPLSVGTLAPNERHRYLFTVTFPDGGKPTSATTGDNVFQDASTQVDFNWEAVTP
jgi:hypothetical protein